MWESSASSRSADNTPGLADSLVAHVAQRLACLNRTQRAVVFLNAMYRYLLTAGLLLATSAFAQKTRTEIVKPTTPEDDAKPNSDKVPEVYAMSGQLKRVVVLRFKYQADLLAGIEKMVKEQK